MNEDVFVVIGSNYSDTACVPKGENIWYKCLNCGEMIPSVPEDNLGCKCGNVFIDKDCWRLIVSDFRKLKVLKKVQ